MLEPKGPRKSAAARAKSGKPPVAPAKTPVKPSAPVAAQAAKPKRDPKPAVVAPKPVAASAPMPPPIPAPVPVAPLATVPVKLAEAGRAVAEETIAAVVKAADAVVATARRAKVTTTHKPPLQKGPFPMATSFAPAPEKIQAMFGDIQSRAKDSIEKSTKLVEEMSEFAKGNVEALLASGRVAAKGAESLGQDAAEYSKKSFEGAAAAFKTMAAVKSPTEFFKLQSDYARTTFDAAVAEGSKFSEAWLKLVGEIAQPLSTRAALAAEKIKAPLA